MGWILLLLLIIAVLLISYLIFFTDNLIHQLFPIFLVIGVIAYSGFGILMDSVNNIYILYLFIFLLLFVISFIIISGKIRDNTPYLEQKIVKEINLKLFSKVFFIIYILSNLIYLVYPEIRITLINPFNTSIVGIIQRIEYYDSFTLLYIMRIISNLAMPFFWIHLFYIFKKNGKGLVLFYLFVDLYIKGMKYEYLGRTDLIIYLLIALLIILYNNNKKFSFKQFFLIFVAVMSLTPFFISYVYTRSGNSYDFVNISKSISDFAASEFFYPQYYDYIIRTEFSFTPAKYIEWLFTLPVPKGLIPNFENYEINSIFSTSISGLNTNDIQFSYYLPSVLGEAFIVWGRTFFWIHAIILGVITGLVYRVLVQYKQLHFYAFFIILRALAVGRAGTQGFISSIINGSILLIIYLIILYIFNKFKKNNGFVQNE